MAVTQVTATSGFMIDGVMMLDGTIDLNGVNNALILDADGDTHISAPTSNQIDISVGGADDFTITANSLNVLSGSTIAGPSSNFYWCAPIAAQQDITGAGAINITTAYTAFTSSGAGQALTLADGAVKGQFKKICHVVDGGSGVLTPTNLASGTTITFTTVGETAELVFDGSDWRAVALYNTVTPGTPPIIA